MVTSSSWPGAPGAAAAPETSGPEQPGAAVEAALPTGPSVHRRRPRRRRKDRREKRATSIVLPLCRRRTTPSRRTRNWASPKVRSTGEVRRIVWNELSLKICGVFIPPGQQFINSSKYFGGVTGVGGAWSNSHTGFFLTSWVDGKSKGDDRGRGFHFAYSVSSNVLTPWDEKIDLMVIIPHKSPSTLVSPRLISGIREAWGHGSPLVRATFIDQNPLLGGGSHGGTRRPGSGWGRWGVVLTHESQLVLWVDWPEFEWVPSTILCESCSLPCHNKKVHID